MRLREYGHLQLIFYKPFRKSIWRGNWFEKLIAIFTLGLESHVEIRWPRTGECYSSAPHTLGGTPGTRFTVYSDEELKANWETIDIPATVDQAAELHQWCLDQVGRKYDWWGILGHAVYVLLLLASIAMVVFGCVGCCDVTGVLAGLSITGWSGWLWIPGLIQRATYNYCSETCSDGLRSKGIIPFGKIHQAPSFMRYRTRRWLRKQI